MASDSEDEALEDLQYDDASDASEGIDEEILDALEGTLAAEESDADDDSDTDDTDDGSEDEESESGPGTLPAITNPPSRDVAALSTATLSGTSHPSAPPSAPISDVPSPHGTLTPARSPSPAPRNRSLSPAGLRKAKLLADRKWPRSFTVEAICAIPHPVSTHALASSLCMSHLITGSEDGYIRDYDIFSAVNGKVFLTAPQRHHCGVMEGLMKAAQIKCWWENPADMRLAPGPIEDPPLSPVYSLLMHSDALWSLAGTEQGHINLFTVRHEPGRLCHTMYGHRGPVSALSMQYDERGFFSAGWDGEALQWDLNTGQVVRNFTAHGAQLAAIAVRPLSSDFQGVTWVGNRPSDLQRNTSALPITVDGLTDTKRTSNDTTASAKNSKPVSVKQEEDAQSDTSFDPLFDDEPDTDAEPPNAPAPGPKPIVSAQPQRGAIAPKNAPPVLEPTTYASFSPDMLMTASIDGQVILWDRRVNSPWQGVGRLWMSEKTPPWCMSACWSADGSQIYAGRRNGTIDVWDVRLTGQAHMGTPRVLKTLRNPVSSGVVSCVVAFPDGKHIACASNDNIRLWNVADAGEPDAFGKMKSGVQFKIIPGHHGGFISQMLVDRAATFLVSASSNRGWPGHGESTRTIFVHEIKNIW